MNNPRERKRIMNISVAMTTYNGEKYLKKQIVSIIKQIEEKDELLISDDGSTDKTVEIIKEFQKDHKNIILFKGPQKGCSSNFEYILKKCKNDIIFLSDQDDIWKKNKVEYVKNYFSQNPNLLLLVHDAEIINEEENVISNSLFRERKMEHGLVKNLFYSGYFGCCMCINKKLLSLALPFPENIEAHDLWLSLVAELNKSSYIMNEVLISYRRHSSNVSHKLPFIEKIKSRIMLIKKIIYINCRKVIK